MAVIWKQIRDKLAFVLDFDAVNPRHKVWMKQSFLFFLFMDKQNK